MKKKYHTILIRLLFCAAISTGIIMNIMQVYSIQKILVYYTLQTNIFCLIAFIAFIIADLLNFKYINKYYYVIKGEMIISSFIMMIVYEIALSPRHFQMYRTSNKEADVLVHIITPIIVIIDYYIFDKKGNFKWKYPILWLIFPLIYVNFVYIYSSFGGSFYSIGGSRKYGYFFLDYEKYGLINVIKWIVCIIVIIIIIGEVLVFIDKKIAQKRKER